ncbi:transporter [Pseudalgibacter alginicilyticus]|uniref:Transporter n=1 Tax=Pseudalgibacter alginicilyticus TaxID=1736674 RepID=A0A0P0CJP1_9FLAO|nr:outer membrane protein transport protein [Pseudalgibacter alginicilyticus]ALJ06450.1 transporter [Pseudalgibacter alginicilyticus]
MKKLNLLFISILSVSFLNAQNITDALRYSQNEIQGTARYRALSGAFGALGGDMSAVSANPASSAIFNQSHASFSASNSNTRNDTRYFNGMGNSSASNFDISQGGAAFVFASNKSLWKKFSFGIAYDKTNNFEDTWYAAGTNTNDDGNFSNSIASYFYDYANNPSIPVRLGDISLLTNETKNQAYADIGSVFGNTHQQAFLGYQSFILDADDDNDDNNTSYYANVGTGNFTHDYTYASTGYNGKIAFNLAAQYNDNLYLGLNLNSHFLNYNKSTLLVETNANGEAINFIEFENNLSTTGSGFSFQLGGIIKVTNEFRIGLTYDSPIWYTIEEETSQYLDTNALIDGNYNPINPQTTNVYPQYKLQTPGKFTGSLAYVFGTQGLLSFDYSRKDYSATQFKPTNDPDFQVENANISDKLDAASTYRLGGEYKLQQFSFRGGYRFEESPYKDGITVGNLNGYSLGIGYNFGNTKLDLTYDQSKRTYETPLYSVGLLETVDIDRKNSNVILSLSFNI